MDDGGHRRGHVGRELGDRRRLLGAVADQLLQRGAAGEDGTRPVSRK